MNKTSKLILVAVIGIIVGAGGTLALSPKNNTQPEMISHGNMNMQGEMGRMAQVLEGKTGDTFDQAFLSEMIVHHQGAVQMAQAALQNAKHQEIKDLATKIISAQESEIIEMQGWQKSWYGQ
ncbi:MAG: hypothetical protein AB202_02095 [Parcubacteria bacterium C7867-007]|nr:MAG: hypothetical protein AB202_02095 [Parcubacteria bacterium C7867-007]